MNQVEPRSVIRFEKRGRELDTVARLTTFRWGVVGKPRRPQHIRVRVLVLTCEKSPCPYPKLVDLGLTKVKRRESSVEA